MGGHRTGDGGVASGGSAARSAKTIGQTFPDPGLAKVVAEANGVDEDAVLTQRMIDNTTRLEAFRKGISNLEGIQWLTGLTQARFEFNHISDLSPLAGLTNLTVLDLWGNNIVDVAPLAGLVNLTYLSLGLNHVADAAPLADLTNLTDLSISNNDISDLSPLSSLTNLAELYLGYNHFPM